MLPTHALWRRSPRILSEQLSPLPAPAALLLEPGPAASADAVCREAARLLLDLPPDVPSVPPWLAPHQIPAFRRLRALVLRHGGAVLADAAGMGKSYVALALAADLSPTPAVLIVPAVLIPQWRALSERLGVTTEIVSTEALSQRTARLPHAAGFVVVDEAHRFRNPDTRRYRALARYLVGVRVLFLTATPVHNRLADLFHLFRLFLRDDALTALGLPSLRLAAAGRLEMRSSRISAIAGRLVVARSRSRARSGYAASPVRLRFPARGAHTTFDAPPTATPTLAALVAGIQGLRGHPAPLLRLTLLRRLASSLAAVRWSLERYAAFLDLAASADRRLAARDFQRCFARTDDGDLQLALLPLLLEPKAPPVDDAVERARVRALLSLCRSDQEPKADALLRLLTTRAMKTIVFTEAAATLKDLVRRLSGPGRLRVAAVAGATGWLGRDRTTREDALRCFAPLAQGAPPPPDTLTADVLLATDLVGEGLSLQDAGRVVHYDLPWSPARLAQRVGRIDRLGSPHAEIDTVAFLPPEPLADALGLERRLADKVEAQVAAGAAEVETVAGRLERDGGSPFDWCDRLQQLAGTTRDVLARGAVAAVGSGRGPRAVLLVVGLGAGFTDAIVVEDDGAIHADPERATILLEQAITGTPVTPDPERLRAALRRAAPLVQERVAAVEDSRWRATDRDRLGRRLIPFALTAARRAARRGDRTALGRLDRLVSRLSGGMSAGEELLLEDLLRLRRSLTVADLLAWDARLPAAGAGVESPHPVLLAAVMLGTLG